MQFTDTSSGDPTGFSWQFGDGDSSTDVNPTHIYDSPGIYTPSLMVSNENGVDLEIKTNMVNVDSGGKSPTPDFTASPNEGPEPLNVQFADESAGNIDSWQWDFGDGVTSTLQNPAHEYIKEGLYNVTLTVSGKDGEASEKKTDFVEILGLDEDVVVVFDAESRTGNAPFTVHFFDKSSGDISDRIWDFGDGEIDANIENPVHTYETPGSFDVELKIFTESGSKDDKIELGFITVEDGADPTVGFVVDEDTGEDDDKTEKFTVEFRDLSSSPDGEIIEREWDFGDGTKSSEKDPVHTFTGIEGDAFTVSLAVANSDGFDAVTKSSFISIASSFVPGFVVGEITDKETGEVVEGVQCCIETRAGAEIVCVNTSKDGGFFLQVASGEYVFAATKDGFKKSRTDIVVKESDFETVNVELEMQQAGDDDDDDSSGKSFTFNCENSMERGFILGLEELTLNVGDTENCTLKLTDHEPGKTVTIGTLLRDGFRSAVELAPENGVTDNNGELEITITAIRKGRDWAAWAVPNDNNVFEFSRETYDTGLAWGMSVKVR